MDRKLDEQFTENMEFLGYKAKKNKNGEIITFSTIKPLKCGKVITLVTSATDQLKNISFHAVVGFCEKYGNYANDQLKIIKKINKGERYNSIANFHNEVVKLEKSYDNSSLKNSL